MYNHIAKNILRGLVPAVPYSEKPETHDIRLHADGHVLDGLELLEFYEGERTRTTDVPGVRLDAGVLKTTSACEFRTAKGKKFICQLGEFSFIASPARAA